MNRHLTDQQTLQYISRTLAPAKQEAVRQHLISCQLCRARLSDAEALQMRIHYSVLTKSNQVAPSADLNFAAIRPQLTKTRRLNMSLMKLSQQTLYGLVTIALLAMLAYGTYSLVSPAAISEGQTASAVSEPVPDEEPAVASVVEDNAAVIDAGEAVSITTFDNLEIKGSFYSAAANAPAPGVVLVHGPGQDRYVWGEFVTDLTENGYAVLAFDLRGYGETGGSPNIEAASEDLRLVWHNFVSRPDVKPSQSFIVGAGQGADMAFQAGTNLPDMEGVVLLSPSPAIATNGKALASFDNLPTLILASVDDGYRIQAAEDFVGKVPAAEMQLIAGDAYGAAILQGQNEATEQIIQWLDTQLADF